MDATPRTTGRHRWSQIAEPPCLSAWVHHPAAPSEEIMEIAIGKKTFIVAIRPWLRKLAAWIMADHPSEFHSAQRAKCQACKPNAAGLYDCELCRKQGGNL